MEKIEFLQGNIACAMGAIYAGCRFFAGYPITPSSEIAEKMALELPKYGGRFIQMEDEIGSMAAVIGASLAGLKAMTATSGPGFSLKQENLGYACITEVPCVIVDVQRGGPSTGLPTQPSQSDIMQARWGTHGDHPIVAVAPSSVYEMFTETVRAFNIAELIRNPVIILSDEIVGHMREKIKIPQEGELEVIDRKKPGKELEQYRPYEVPEGDVIPLMAAYGDGHRFHTTGLNHDETGFPTTKSDFVDKEERRLFQKIEKHRDYIDRVDYFMAEDAELIIVAIGSISRSAQRAVKILREKGKKIGLFRPVTVWPFPERQLVELLAKGVKHVVVAEMNLGQLVLEVERINNGRAKVHSVCDVTGHPISPDMIVDYIENNIN